MKYTYQETFPFAHWILFESEGELDKFLFVESELDDSSEFHKFYVYDYVQKFFNDNNLKLHLDYAWCSSGWILHFKEKDQAMNFKLTFSGNVDRRIINRRIIR